MRNAHLERWSLMAEISEGTSGSLYLSLWCVSRGTGLSCHLLSLLCPLPQHTQATGKGTWWVYYWWLSSSIFVFTWITSVNYSVLEKWTGPYQRWFHLHSADLGCCSSDGAATPRSKILLTLEQAGERKVFSGVEGKWAYIQVLECLDEKVPYKSIFSLKYYHFQVLVHFSA